MSLSSEELVPVNQIRKIYLDEVMERMEQYVLVTAELSA
jgi:hypothetical protein